MSRAGRIALIVFGAILLLPGACSLAFVTFGAASVSDLLSPRTRNDPISNFVALVWFGGLALGALGISILVWANRRGR